VVYGVWAYPAYRPFYWYPPGYVAAGVFGFGAPFVVGTALWAHYNWESRHVDINVVNYNKFNHTNIVNNAANQTWQHDPRHRGNIPYGNATLQQKFGKAATSNVNVNPGLQKSNIANPVNLKGGTTAPLNNNAITNLNKNGGPKNLKIDKNTDQKLDRRTDLKVDKNADLKVDKKPNVNGNRNTNNTNNTKTMERRVNVDTGPKGNTNAAVRTNGANNFSRSVNVQNVGRNVPPVKPAGGVPKDKKKP
jgi:hypothetical protein